MNEITQKTFFEQKNPNTIRRQLENKIKSKPIIPRKKNLIHINHPNISSKAINIPDIFSNSIEKNKKNISYNRIAQKRLKSKSQEKSVNDDNNNNTKKKEKKDILYFPMNNDFSLSNAGRFPNKRNNKIKLMESISENSNLNHNNNIINNLKQFPSKNINTLYKKENISTSLPKIKIKKNPLSNKEIEKDTIMLNKEKRAVSQRTINYYNIQKITNIKSKIATKFNVNNNNSSDNNININVNNNINNQLSLNELLNDYYPLYQPAKHSQKSFENICGYGVNTYKGIIRQYNEDRVTILINANIKNNDNVNNAYKINYFSIYDGHAGNKCCDYVKTYLHQYIFDSDFFPENPIKAIEQGFKNCENNFLNSINSKNQYIDSSGSCAIIILIINDFCYIINLGDSRALLSSDDGKKFFQLSRDHKPNDVIEKKRIYKAGGSIYRANIQQKTENSMGLNAKEVLVNLPYRIYPGRLSVSYFLIL